MIYVFYHKNCDDGFGAAYAAWQYFHQTQGMGEDKVQYVAAEYGDEPPALTKDDDVLIFDFSYPPETLLKMAAGCASVVLYDHHKSAQKKWVEYLQSNKYDWKQRTNLHVHFDLEHSGAALAFMYFNPGSPLPLFFRYLEARDLWQKDRLENVDWFTRGLRSYPMEFEVWDKLGVAHLLEEGQHIERYCQNRLATILKNYQPQPIVLYGSTLPVQGLAINGSNELASELGEALAERSGTFGAVYTVVGNKVHVSLRSNGNVDVSVLATAYGGGGHPKSSGYKTTIHDWRLSLGDSQ